MQTQTDRMLATYERSLRINAHPNYLREARRFAAFAQGNFDRQTLLRYIHTLQRERYSPGYIVKVVLTTVRKFYKVNGLEYPLRSGEGITLNEGDVYAPALHPDLVRRMIQAAKTKAVFPLDRAFLALSTTYGLRRVEMTQIRSQDINLRDGTIFIRTAKKGRQRWHLIPEEIRPYLAIRWRQVTPDAATRIYRRLEAAAGIERMPDVGWHAIRRILVRLLVEAGLHDHVITNFLRWKRGGQQMSRIYFSTTVVGEHDQQIHLGKPDREVDLAVFRVHPFLAEWINMEALDDTIDSEAVKELEEFLEDDNGSA